MSTLENYISSSRKLPQCSRMEEIKNTVSPFQNTAVNSVNNEPGSLLTGESPHLAKAEVIHSIRLHAKSL